MTMSGCSWEYNYQSLNVYFSNEELVNYCNKRKLKYLEKIKTWDEDLNTEWTLRNYMSVKMIMASTLMLNSLKYSKEKNLKITENYLIYYSILNCARALVYSLPNLEWDKDKLSLMNHTKIIALASDAFSLLSKDKAKELCGRLEEAKEIREIFSYQFPMDGTNTGKNLYTDFELLLNDCTLLVELAQLNSECLFGLYEKKVVKKYPIKDSKLYSLFVHSEDFGIVDESDKYWITRLTRESEATITHIAGLMKEGMVDDFFVAWNGDESDDEEMSDRFDSDHNIRILFDFC